MEDGRGRLDSLVPGIAGARACRLVALSFLCASSSVLRLEQFFSFLFRHTSSSWEDTPLSPRAAKPYFFFFFFREPNKFLLALLLHVTKFQTVHRITVHSCLLK